MFSKARFATMIPVRKMDRAIKFYTEALGGKVTYKGEGEMKDSFASVKVAGQDFWLITPSAWEKRELSYSVFMVDDIRAVVQELRGRGVRFQRAERMTKETKIEGPIAFETFGASAFFKDTEGNLLMVWQNNPPMR
jgi:catechol 2,3-dioxygenase-like lactoylglutathione lyase family enzyme